MSREGEGRGISEIGNATRSRPLGYWEVAGGSGQACRRLRKTPMKERLRKNNGKYPKNAFLVWEDVEQQVTNASGTRVASMSGMAFFVGIALQRFFFKWHQAEITLESRASDFAGHLGSGICTCLDHIYYLEDNHGCGDCIARWASGIWQCWHVLYPNCMSGAISERRRKRILSTVSCLGSVDLVRPGQELGFLGMYHMGIQGDTSHRQHSYGEGERKCYARRHWLVLSDHIRSSFGVPPGVATMPLQERT